MNIGHTQKLLNNKNIQKTKQTKQEFRSGKSPRGVFLAAIKVMCILNYVYPPNRFLSFNTVKQKVVHLTWTAPLIKQYYLSRPTITVVYRVRQRLLGCEIIQECNFIDATNSFSVFSSDYDLQMKQLIKNINKMGQKLQKQKKWKMGGDYPFIFRNMQYPLSKVVAS